MKIEDLKQSRLVKYLSSYLAFVFIVLQVVDIISEPFSFSENLIVYLVYVFAFIFVCIVIIAIRSDKKISPIEPINDTKQNNQSNKITTLLPSINECNYIQTKLLIFAEAILICGFFSGLSLQYFLTGAISIIDHKAIFTILAMVVIAIILFLQERSGVRGKIAVRFIMLAYLLLTLAYPGVKFVAQIVI